MAYTINSKNGYELAQETKKNPGKQYTASDGSKWWTDPSTGKLMVDHQGSTGEANLAYGNSSAGASSGSSGSTSGSAKKDLIYWVGTDEGRKVLENLYNGSSKEYTASDGSRWYLGSDGNAYADHYGNQLQIQLRNQLNGSGGGSRGSGGGSSGAAGDTATGGDAGGSSAGTEGSGSSTIVSGAVQAKKDYADQMEEYRKQLLAMRDQKSQTATDQSEYIRQMYENQLAANKAQLEQNYNQNLSNLEGEESGLGANYYEQRRQAQANADKAQANFNEIANASGLNSGTGGQAALSRSNQLQSNLTALNNAEAQNRAEIERQRTLLGQQYQSAIQQAQAENNMELAQRLYQEATRVDNSIIEASRTDSSRALDILNIMLNQISSDRTLASEEARQAAEIAAAGGKYGLYGELYGLSDDVVKKLEDIYNRELSDTQYARELELYEKEKENRISSGRRYSWQEAKAQNTGTNSKIDLLRQLFSSRGSWQT